MNDLAEQQLGHWVRQLNHVLIHSISETLKPFDLGHSQWQVLSILDAEKKISIKKLREQMNVESGTLTGVIDALIRKGWVLREEDPKDRRIKQIMMTKTGQIRWASLPNPKSLVHQKLSNNIPLEEIAVTVKVLQQAYENLTAK
ncbi:MarR family transcriptional regulator [Shimazuella sp. AN120528]|uniref:MarR family winged helix-turn-helix transcriptional regulator n=1 Tax=Shimazuella soli TaxID=1892854 RepID=UPI001F0D0B1B|nr:MarR family transcriptional regulator [Shimazuella soli]MCH5583975.1 MarR family transcriptional regulator [Shimazuella soli]